MVTIAIIAGHTLLKFDMGEVGNQLSENGPADIHPLLFRQSAEGLQRDLSRRFRPFSVQIVFWKNAAMLLMAMRLSDFAKCFTGH